MSWIEIPQDKRHAMRVHPPGTVVLRRYEELLRGRIVDLATDGVGLRSDLAFDVDELVGQVVRVHIALDRGAAAWSALGHVVRAVPATQTIAIAFDDVPSELEDYVQDQLLDVVEHDVPAHVILVDANPGRRAAIAHAFRTAGCHVVETTAGDASSRIFEAGDELDVVALPDTTPESVAEDLRELLLEAPHFVRWDGAAKG